MMSFKNIDWSGKLTFILAVLVYTFILLDLGRVYYIALFSEGIPFYHKWMISGFVFFGFVITSIFLWFAYGELWSRKNKFKKESGCLR